MEPYEELKSFACWRYKTQSYIAASWKDKQTVNMLSNIFSMETVLTQQQQNKKEEKSDKYIPMMADDYTQGGMGHVDTFDATLSCFYDHYNISWRRTHFLSILKMSIINA